MTNKLEKKFFDTFEIEQRIEFEPCYALYSSTTYLTSIKRYPQITDRILLELICIWNNACLYLEDNIAPINYQKITKTVLEYFVDIENYRFAIAKQDIKHQVRTLFEEG